MSEQNSDDPNRKASEDTSNDAGGFNRRNMLLAGTTVAAVSALAAAAPIRTAQAEPKQQQPAAPAGRPNIIMIISDDTGYGDLGPYGGGDGRGMPTPNIDRLATEGHDVLLLLRPAELHARPRGHADRSHPEPQRHDHRDLPGPGRRAAGGGVDAGVGAQDRRLQDLLHRQVASRRGRLRAAQRARLRRDAVLRPLSPQRLHLRRSDLVPGHAGETARHVPEGDQGHAVGQRRRAGDRGVQAQRPVCRHARRRAWSAFRSSMPISRRRRSTISTRTRIRKSRSS